MTEHAQKRLDYVGSWCAKRLRACLLSLPRFQVCEKPRKRITWLPLGASTRKRKQVTPKLQNAIWVTSSPRSGALISVAHASDGTILHAAKNHQLLLQDRVLSFLWHTRVTEQSCMQPRTINCSAVLRSAGPSCGSIPHRTTWRHI